MSDIFREVDEELRHERYMKLWERYGIYVVGAALLVVLAVGGWRGWEWYQAREAARSSVQFEDALRLVENNQRFEAEAEFNRLASEGTGGYRTLSRFAAASEAAKSDRAQGVKAYEALAADASLGPVLRDLARLQAAILLVDTEALPEFTTRIEPLAAAQAPFRHSARELLGLAQYRAGERAAAAKTFTSILADAETPPGLRNRAQMMQGLLADVATPAPAAVPATQ